MLQVNIKASVILFSLWGRMERKWGARQWECDWGWVARIESAELRWSRRMHLLYDVSDEFLWCAEDLSQRCVHCCKPFSKSCNKVAGNDIYYVSL